MTLVLLAKLAPLYLFVALGFLAGRYLKVRKESIAPLLIYILAPAVIFNGTLTTTLDAARLALPLVVYVLCCSLCLLTLRFAPFERPARNILAFAAGNANSGYFGIPAAIALLGEDAFSQAAMLSFGFVFCENTVGFYASARGHATPRQALDRVLRLPTAYAFVLGLTLRIAGASVPTEMQGVFLNIRGAYTVLGMMLLGMALSDIARLAIDWRFTGYALSVKYIAWPLLMLGVVSTGWFDPLATRGLMLVSLLPMAANTVAIATLHNSEPEKTSVAVLMSTAVSLLIIPALGGLL